MFLHNFYYSIKILFRNRMLIFWTFAFPLVLSIFFHMAFSNIEKSEQLDTIPIAIVKKDANQEMKNLKEVLSSFKDQKSKKKLFSITETNRKKAEKMLRKDLITGYLFMDENIGIMVKQNGINETILRYTVDTVLSNKEIIAFLSKKEMEDAIKKGKDTIDIEKVSKHIEKMTKKDTANLNDTTKENLSYTMIEYYTLIAMTCLYGGILSMFIVNYQLANMTNVGKRISISPVHKRKMLLGSLLSSYLIQLLGIAILFLFTIFILKVDYGSHLLQVVLLAICGSFAGLSLGIAVATLVKSNENTKIGILIAITMFGCFLSGMMGPTMKYIIDKNVPLLNKINPASMITDGLYSLYYYDTYSRFTLNVISLLLFSLFMIFISNYGLRRQKYDSI